MGAVLKNGVAAVRAALYKIELAKEEAHIVKADIGVRRAAHDLLENLVGPAHGRRVSSQLLEIKPRFSSIFRIVLVSADLYGQIATCAGRALRLPG